MRAYTSLETLFTQLYRYRHLLSLAAWDSQVNSPANTFEARGLALAQLEGDMHRLATADITTAWLAEAAAGKDALSPVQRANLREMQRIVTSESCLPGEFLARKSIATTKAQALWAQSRSQNSFKLFSPSLKEVVALAREEGAYRSSKSSSASTASASAATVGTSAPAVYPSSPYEALIDTFEPGMTLARIDELFTDIKTWLPDLLREVLVAQQAEAAVEGPLPTLKGPFPVYNQRMLATHIMENVWEFDFTRGRLDESPHPFTGNVKEDCRVTTNYTESNFTKALLGVVHETGHAKYEMNMGPRDMITQPVCNARSLGIHESQSLLAEKMIGRSATFTHCLLPALKTFFPKPPDCEGETEISSLTEDGLRRVMQKVEQSPIRVDADEVCYPLHVILRYEIERDLIAGKLEAEDVPCAWNEKMQSYLGIDTTGRDDVGCLQDIHWAGGAFGYFPTYSLGALFAAQLMATIRKELGDATVDECLRTGNLSPIFAKQKEKIWDLGCTLETEELMVKATGEKLNPQYFRDHLTRRYLKRES